MRRIAVLIALLGAVAAWVTSLAGASDTHTYHVEMYNAFGIVNGSNVRIAVSIIACTFRASSAETHENAERSGTP